MFVKKLRRRLFGFKKSDVFDFVTEIDQSAAEKLAEKEKQIDELKARLAVLDAERDSVIKALSIAEETAAKVIEEAREKADAMLKEAEAEVLSKKEQCEAELKEKREQCELEIQEKKNSCESEIQLQKNNVNREIDIKKKAIKNYYATENKKIDQIKSEVERMRKASMDAIQNFERQLRAVERMTENSGAYVESASDYAQTGAVPSGFVDVEREIPIHIIESISE